MKTGVPTSQCYVRGMLIDVRLMPTRPTLPLICRLASCALLVTQLSLRGSLEELSVVRKHMCFNVTVLYDFDFAIIYRVQLKNFRVQFLRNGWTFYSEILCNHCVMCIQIHLCLLLQLILETQNQMVLNQFIYLLFWVTKIQVLIPPGKSWNLIKQFSRPGKSWKQTLVTESHGI